VQSAAVHPVNKPSVISMPSPNHGSRPGGPSDISAIVLHHTASGTVSAAQNIGRYFQNPAAEVSSHYIIGKDGAIVQSVQDGDRAWHAGESTFQGRGNVNDYSLGIEIVNAGDNQDAYTDAQYSALIDLCAWMMKTYNISLERITGHRDICIPKGRKTDPSDNFDWDRVKKGVTARLAGQMPASAPSFDPEDRTGDNLALGTSGPRVKQLQQDLRDLGYFNYPENTGNFASITHASVKKFQADHGLDVDGVVGPKTAAAIKEALKSKDGTPSTAAAKSSYTVASGDTLFAIARRLLGDGTRWREIYNLNQDILKDPNKIYPGQTLKLP
jgi:N-acetyl-anhydromuramyl-L-alanine amidase AmpD